MADQEKDLDKQVSEELEKEAEAKASETETETPTEETEAGETEQETESGEPEAGEEACDEPKPKNKTSFKEKFMGKDKAKSKEQEKIAELEDRVMRQMAEFENYRRRTEKEKQAMFETGARSVIEKILPVIDNFERGLSTIPEAEKESGFANGMNMIYKQLLTELDNMGVKAIEAVGKEFDPHLHNAVMQVASEEYESGIVAQELLKGYTYRDSVVRHSMVAVTE